jgi:hypothetical protein
MILGAFSLFSASILTSPRCFWAVFKLIFVVLIQTQRFGHLGGNFVQRFYHFG